MARKILLTRIAQHEFSRAFRVWQHHHTPLEIFRAIYQQRSNAIKSFLRALGLAVLLMLWIASNKTELSLRVHFIEVSVPISYVNFGLAVMTFLAGLGVINYFFLNDLVRLASNKVHRWASTGLILMNDGSDTWSIPLIAQFRFFESSRPHFVLGAIVGIWLNIPMLVIFVALYWTVFSTGLSVLYTSPIASLPTVLTAIGWSLMLFPLLFIFYVTRKFTFKKNKNFIRWLFLNRIYQKDGFFHPRIDNWIAESEKMKSGK